jgi:hypothetical protein
MNFEFGIPREAITAMRESIEGIEPIIHEKKSMGHMRRKYSVRGTASKLN